MVTHIAAASDDPKIDNNNECNTELGNGMNKSIRTPDKGAKIMKLSRDWLECQLPFADFFDSSEITSSQK